jgi:PEP-CTERM motif
MKKAIIGLGLTALLSSAGASATVVYSNDFSSGSSAGITGANAVQTAPSGEKFVGMLNFGETATLSLSGLAAHSSVSLSFDVLGLRSLDGTTSSDNFELKVNSATVFRDYFGHNGWGGSAITGPTTGTLVSHDASAMGYGQFYGGVSIYHYDLTFSDIASAIQFDFIGNTNQPWGDEAFGIDNISVSIAETQVVSEPGSLALLGLGLAGLGFSRRRASK